MLLQDFVMLGKTIPEPASDGRIFVCSAGVSPDLRSLVRIYPLAWGEAPRRWSISEVPVMRNPRDSRQESFQLCGDRSVPGHGSINRLFHPLGNVARHHRDQIIGGFLAPSIKALNKDRASLGIINPLNEPGLEFEFREDAPDSPQLALFVPDKQERRNLGAKRFAFQPYLSFRDEAGWHRLQLRDWGAYEFMRKYGDDRRHELRDACRLPGRPRLMVGNMSHQRTTWLVISVLFPVRQLALAL